MIVDLNAAEGQTIWRPDADTVSDTGVARFADFLSCHGIAAGDRYNEMWQWSVDNPELFWEQFVEFAGIDLRGDPGPTLRGSSILDTRWFPGRTVNFARHLLEGREGLALLCLDEEGNSTKTTWAELRGRVGALAAELRTTGVRAGDRVVAILPNIEEAVVAMLAVTSIGAIWSICAPEFGPGAIASRFAQLGPKVLIAAPGYRVNGADRDRRAELAAVITELPTLERVIWVTAHTEVPAPDGDLNEGWEGLVERPRAPLYAELEFSHPLWVLFSSGTTGRPKGIVHGHGGALIEMMKMHLIHCDLRPGDRFLSVASTSWVVWNSLVCVLGAGATAILVDGNATYPNVNRVWDLAAATRATALGVSAGFVHACAKADLTPAEDLDLRALRLVQVTGSPLSAEGACWVYRAVGDVWLSSASGGTDVASIFVGGVPTEPVKLGYIQVPALGVRVEAWNDDGTPADGTGELVVTAAMPSMPLCLWGDSDGSRYRASYFEMFPGVWRHGDYIEFAEAGIRIHGRSDSTLNRNGLRLGTADIYSVVEALPDVVEALVVGAELGTDGYYMPLFVQLRDGANEESVRAAIASAIRANLSARYLPDEIVIAPGIPHTRTGKKLEVPVKRLIQGVALTEVVDTQSVDDAEVLTFFARFAASAVV
ncbi:hypothetical protein ASF40_09215 [Microbacterium sp. Leaf288]|uniref:acetoacetate--CoA ligase n=1 Tax=Microbacterium sp. Leaf288 TaxID=1736323 RepID=UPI00070042C9|nr:acetoacetate--CoA ligase [Microbacterium sp. Leaf288]KQP70007.1 hypothetical protein ASF40_09215 [Microbacterium sp. Leaf288]